MSTPEFEPAAPLHLEEPKGRSRGSSTPSGGLARSDRSGGAQESEPADPEDHLPRLLFSFRGRLARRSFWLYGVLGVTLVQFLSYAFLAIAGFAEGVADGLGTLIVAWPSLAITCKRWHDRNKSAWWLLIVLVPVVGLVWTLIECGLLRGSAGDNRYGAEPVHTS